MDKSPYDVLGVPETASADEVKRAYRQKARENHPDINPDDPDAARRMNEVNEAYDRIVNPEKYTRRQPGTGYGSGSYPGSARRGAASGGGYAGSGYSGSGGYGTGQGYSGSGQGYSGSGYGPQSDEGGFGGNPYGWPFDDLFGGGWVGNAGTVSMHPEVSAGDGPEVRRAIDCINSNRHQQAVEILAAIPSTGRSARWYYLSALAHNGAGNTLTALEQIRKAVMMDPNNSTYRVTQQAFQQAGERYQQESQEQGFSLGSISPTMLCCTCCAMQYAMRFCYGF